MIREFVSNHIFMSSILLVGALSLILQGMITLALYSYVKASANMKTTRKKVMIHLKNQFETIYGMNYQVRNIRAYVDKYLLKLRLLGISYMNVEKIPFLSAGIVTLLMVIGISFGYLNGVKARAQVEILSAYGIVLACLFSFFHIYGIKSKKKQIQIQLVDYLENYMTNRLMKNKEDGTEWKVLDPDTEKAIMNSEYGKENPLKKASDLEQIAFSEEEKMEEEKDHNSEESDLELLEEFVQSFLA
ncbi:MAG: hypothetical protein Q4D51_06660 [Eubacteriales bacterium]|nr:hypothetical protein [Eubacteriales bacterium]